jgi:signal transduction histidine kinase
MEEQLRQTQKMEALGRLAGGVAHDFNNLLAIIRMSTGIMKRQVGPEHAVWSSVRRIQDTSDRATRLVKQLMDFSAGETVESEPVDLNQVVGDLRPMLERLVGSEIELVTERDEELCPIRANYSQMEQVIVNLAVNARDAMPNGGTLVVETAMDMLAEREATRHGDARPGRHVRLTVRDTGVGMTEEVKARIFEPFFTTKNRGEGRGLGLATVFGIVNQSAGHIRVRSAIGQGTEFKVYLPCLTEN